MMSRRVVCSQSIAAAAAFAQDVIALLNPSPLPPPARDGSPQLGWWLAGLTVLADWIGSAETWFRYRAPDLTLGDYWHDCAQPRAARALGLAGIQPSPASATLRLADMIGSPVAASPMQRLAQSLDLDAEGPVLVLVEDQTGSGKTEAALLLAHRLMTTGRADGLFVALPTMATANAAYDRLATAYRSLFRADAAPSLVLAHARRGDHPGFRQSILEDAASDDGEDDCDAADMPASAQCAAWIADDRRRCFLADVGVGTIDQALFSVLPTRHAPLRLFGLHRRVLVIDEAHAYDAYMREELLRLVAFQAGLGGSTIILSATLPQTTRRKLAAAYTQMVQAPAAAPASAAYPLVTVLHRARADETPCAGREGLVGHVVVERMESTADVLDRIASAARAGQAVAWVRNAVDDAAAAHADLAARGIDATLFHARFAMGDRLTIERDVVARFGKRSALRGGVVVATQVIEQSLDLDFDLMVSDLAPMDLLIQRAGRLWRHQRSDRPADRPRLLVLSPEPVAAPDAGWLGEVLRRTGRVYEDHALLWRSAKVLFAAGAITAPGDVRRLVEAAYDQDADVPAALQRRASEAEGRASAAISLARQNLLEWRAGYTSNAGAWASDTRTPTRLGEAGTIFRLARWQAGRLEPFCAADTPERAWALSEVTLGPWLADGVPAADAMLERAAAAVRRGWNPWQRELPIVALTGAGDTWVGIMVRGGEERRVQYGARSGLRLM
jgi:CRISPR-associated endonuclease/helicase Cas3